jgi:transglutaminase-like putative cysteine protease
LLISIGHVTRSALAATANYSIHCLRLTPPSFDAQQVVSWSIEMPQIDNAVRFRDCFGNMAHLVALSEPHQEISIVARGTVDTRDCAGVVRGLVEIAPSRVYKRETTMTAPDDGIRELCAEVTADDSIERMHKLMETVHERVKYVVGVTHAHTNAADALKDGQGVCQDHAHIFISAARVMGLPARYVNGYFLTDSDAPAEAHHAWAEVWVGGLGWIGFDPANNMCPTDSYVRLAWGLDAGSAAPIRGTRRGGAEEVLDVVVEVQQQSTQQQ